MQERHVSYEVHVLQGYWQIEHALPERNVPSGHELKHEELERRR
jgi:hypothetical protein